MDNGNTPPVISFLEISDENMIPTNMVALSKFAQVVAMHELVAKQMHYKSFCLFLFI